MNLSLRNLQQALSIRRQIDALEKRLSAILGGSRAKPKAPRAATKSGLTPADRRRLSRFMKTRWAARRKSPRRWAPKKARKKAARVGGPSPAGRRRLSELMKARWAARRKSRRKLPTGNLGTRYH